MFATQVHVQSSVTIRGFGDRWEGEAPAEPKTSFSSATAGGNPATRDRPHTVNCGSAAYPPSPSPSGSS